MAPVADCGLLARVARTGQLFRPAWTKYGSLCAVRCDGCGRPCAGAMVADADTDLCLDCVQAALAGAAGQPAVSQPTISQPVHGPPKVEPAVDHAELDRLVGTGVVLSGRRRPAPPLPVEAVDPQPEPAPADDVRERRRAATQLALENARARLCQPVVTLPAREDPAADAPEPAQISTVPIANTPATVVDEW